MEKEKGKIKILIKAIALIGIVKILVNIGKGLAPAFNSNNNRFHDNVLYEDALSTLTLEERKAVRDFMLNLMKQDETNGTNWQQNLISFIATFVERGKTSSATEFLKTIANSENLEEQMKVCDSINIFSPIGFSAKIVKEAPGFIDRFHQAAEDFKNSAR